MKIKLVKGVITILLSALLFIGLFISILSGFLVISEWFDHTYFDQFLREFFFEVALMFTIFLFLRFSHMSQKRVDSINFTGIWLIILFYSLFIAGIFAYVFGNSSLWFFKYTIGIIILPISFLVSRRHLNIQTIILTTIISFYALFFCETVELFISFDPPANPTTIYINSFPNMAIGFIFLLYVVVPATLISKELIINKLPRRSNEANN